MVISMPHKEDRFIMPIIPAMCLLSGLFISQLGKVKKVALGLVFIVLIISFYHSFEIETRNSKDLTVACFIDGNKFLSSGYVNKNSLVVTNQDPITHYYTKKDILIYPEPWNLDLFKKTLGLKTKYDNIYIFFANYDMVMNSRVKTDLDNNFNKVFECQKDYGYSTVYQYK